MNRLCGARDRLYTGTGRPCWVHLDRYSLNSCLRIHKTTPYPGSLPARWRQCFFEWRSYPSWRLERPRGSPPTPRHATCSISNMTLSIPAVKLGLMLRGEADTSPDLVPRDSCSQEIRNYCQISMLNIFVKMAGRVYFETVLRKTNDRVREKELSGVAW